MSAAFSDMLRMFSTSEENRIADAICKLDENLSSPYVRRVCVSISGGSDSDMMLDMVQALEPERNYPNVEIHYVWFDTGLEYRATKDHIAYLEERYSIHIEPQKAKVPVPLGCKRYGLPFLSKTVSEYLSRLQRHGFQWENEPLDVLLDRYPKCRAALRFWCNDWGEDSRINIKNYRLLKEFIMSNPPTFQISKRCCDGAKKDVAHDYCKELGIDLDLVGVRQAEGGARATAYNGCFSEPTKESTTAQFRPLFWISDADKEIYCEKRGVTHSDLYAKYGFVRTGCSCFPFGSRFEKELLVAEWIDAGLEKAAQNIFGPAYEYTRAYRRFKAKADADAKKDPDQYEMEGAG